MELLTALDNNPTMQFLVGGFRDECVFPLREAAMDYAAMHGRPIWIIAGAATDELIDCGIDCGGRCGACVRCDYERYKYMFRVTFNQTVLLRTLLYFLWQLAIPKLKGAFGIPLTSPLPAAIVAENLVWCDAMVTALNDRAPLLGYSVVYTARPSAIETVYGPILDAIESSGAKLIFHIFSAVAGASFIKAWGEQKTPAMPVGINVESTDPEYETIVDCVGTRTNINPDAKPLGTAEFWDEYTARYGHAPLGIAFHAYNAIIILNETAADCIGKTCDQIIPILEQTNEETFLGRFRFTGYHDVYCDDFAYTPIWPPAGWPAVPTGIGTVRPLVVQWQAGRLEVVWPRGYKPAPGSLAPPALQDPTPLPWARKWKVPPWMYSLAETDFAGGPIIPIPPVTFGTVGSTPAGFFGYFNTPDGSVGPADMSVITSMWRQTCVWTVLEADMDGNNFIDINDINRVAMDWGKTG